MSIHEVTYDYMGRITDARCIDEDIRKAELSSAGDGMYPSLVEVIPDLDENPRFEHIIVADSPDSVTETETLSGIDTSGTPYNIETSRATYRGEEINHSYLRASESVTEVEKGFVWTPQGQAVDIYVAPKGLRARVLAALGI